jgi:hypothetical protein
MRLRQTCASSTIGRKFRLLSFAGFICFAFSCIALAQDSPGRFELGGSVTSLRDFRVPNVGIGLEGDFNLNRHIAVDVSLDLLPSQNDNTVVGLFGVKAGKRTDHFGFFAKARPGFITTSNVFRESVLSVSPSFNITRFSRLTERALDLGGVVEYYPARHWALRWDAGDMLIFEDDGPTFTAIFPGQPPIVTTNPGKTTNNFRFSAGVHYRF